jgi:hypothetical protein
MARPAYVEFGGLASAPGPLLCNDTTLYVFGLEADHAKLDALCRRVFAEPTGGAVDLRPLGPHVLLTFGVVGSIVPQLEPWRSMGDVREPQVAFWVPVAWVERERDGDLVGTRFGMFCAAIMLDNPISLLSGREVYGYPKTLGWPSELPAEGETTPFTLDVFGMNFGAGDQPSRRRLLELRPVADDDAHDLVVEDLRSVGRWMRETLFPGDGGVEVGFRLGWDIARDMAAGRVDQVFLKQVRAADDGRQADLQQVVVAPAHVHRLRAKRLNNDYELVLEKLDSHPLGAELGLRSQSVKLAGRLQFDFLIDAGTVEWSSGPGGRR